MWRGYIKLWRKSREHELWKKKPFDPFRAWIDLVMSAEYEDTEREYKGKMYLVVRGNVLASRRYLSKRWGWAETKVRRFLKYLEKEGQITAQRGTQLKAQSPAQLTVLNYNQYQSKRPSNRPSKGPKGKKDKEGKEVKDSLFEQDSNEYRLASYLLKHILSRRNGFKKPDMQKWSQNFDSILRIDKRGLQETKDIIEWCQKDDFWQNTILSPGKLRKQFDVLALKMGGTQEKDGYQDF